MLERRREGVNFTGLTRKALLGALVGVLLAPLSFVACNTRPPQDPTAHRALSACEPGLATVPGIFSLPSAEGLSSPALALDRIALAECIDATSTRQLAEIEAREQRARRAVADLIVPLGVPRSESEVRELRAADDDGRADQARASAELDGVLDGLYATRIPASERGEDTRPLLAVALFDYARLVREHYGRRAHTVVPALRDEASCRGDFIESRLLWRYFEAALRTRAAQGDAAADAVRALHAIALQTACQGEQQLFELDRAMSYAAVELEERLKRAGVPTLLADVEPFVLQVRLLFFDADKHLGVESPSLSWWLSRSELRARLLERATWPIERVLWLYDRRTAAMVAVKTACKDGGSGTGCLNLSVFVETLTRPVAFGAGECAFLQMIEGGIRSVNGAPAYTCTDGLCGTPTDTGRIVQTKLAGTFGSALQKAGAGYRLPHFPSQTPFGVPLEEAQAHLCTDASGAGIGGQNGSAGMSGPGMGAGGALLACVVGGQAPAPGMSCIARHVQATSPLNPLQESMTATRFAGVPPGCALRETSADGGTPGSDGGAAPNGPTPGSDGGGAGTEDEAKKKAEADLKKAAEELAKDQAKLNELKQEIKKQTGIDVTDAQLKAALAALAGATVQPGNAPVEDGKKTAGETNGKGEITIYLETWLANGGAGSSKNVNVFLHEFVHSVMAQADESRHRTWNDARSDEDKRNWRQAYEERDQAIMKGWGFGKVGRCVNRSARCNDACNGMSRQTQQTLACLEAAFHPETIPPRVIDLVSDPIEPESANGSRLAQCFAEPLDASGVVAAERCSAVRCANANLGTTAGGCCVAGGALGQDGVRDQRRKVCDVARCESSASTAGSAPGVSTTCGCASGYAGSAPGTLRPPPSQPFTPSAPGGLPGQPPSGPIPGGPTPGGPTPGSR